MACKYLKVNRVMLLFLLSVVLYPVCVLHGYAEPPTHLFSQGKSDYTICISDVASPSEKYAAEELQSYVKKSTGVSLPIVTQGEGDFMIVLGFGEVTASLGIEPDIADLGEQGYIIRTAGKHLLIAGTPEAGTLYGVYDFLETYLGVRWYAPGVTHVPQLNDVPLPKVDKTFVPAFQWRHTSYAWPGGDEAFRIRMRDNSGSGDGEHPFGIQHIHDGRCHSYFRYVSPGEYFETHPEYFSEIGGVRRSHETQLCLTNPDVLEIVTEKMLKRMVEQPNARQHNFSQMDYYNYCECEKCRAINEQYGTLGGTQYWFLNQLAERTSKVYPEKLIGTLAYMYTEEPPQDMKMHPNIAVWLCHMFPTCDSHPIATCPLDADYKRRAMKWSEITKHLYIWHYIVDFAHYYNPFPNFRAMASDMRFYRDIGVEGIYLQGMGHGGGGGEWSLLRPWYGMKLVWNPDQDANAIMRDFLNGYYGAAATPLYEYITLLEGKVEKENIHHHLYTNPAQGYLTDEVLERSVALFDAAEAAVAEDEELLERVRVARMPLTYAYTFPRNGYRIENQTLLFNGPLAPLDEISVFLDRMKAHGFQAIRERQGDPDQLMMLGLALSLPLEAPRIQNDALEADIVPFLGGRVLRITDRATGKCVTGYNITRNLFFPFCGGEETRIGGIYDIDGMFYQFAIEEQQPSSITLLVDTGSWLIRRKISLVENKPVIQIATTLENLGGGVRETIVRTHTNFDLGTLDSVRVVFENRRGEHVERDLKAAIAGLREGEKYMDTDAPKGEWRLAGDKGVEIIQRFPDEEVDFAWLYAFPDYLNDLEAEVWAKPVMLEPGHSKTFIHEIEVQVNR